MVFLYCFLRLNLKTRILAARSAPTMVPVTLPPETSSPPSLKDALTASSTSVPISPASFSTRITSPGATRYCFPPVSMIACMQTSGWEPEHTKGVGTTGVKYQCTTSARLVQIRERGGIQVRLVHALVGHASACQSERSSDSPTLPPLQVSGC